MHGNGHESALYPELAGRSLRDLQQLFLDVSPDPHEAGLYYEELAHCIRSYGRNGATFLLDLVPTADEGRLRAILSAVSFPNIEGEARRAVLGLLREYLQDARPLVVQEAVDGLARQRDKAGLPDILELRGHASPYVRSSVLRYLSSVEPEASIRVLVEALTDSDYVVRENAIDQLDDLGIVESVAHIRPLLNDPEPDVREAAATALASLTEHQVGLSEAQDSLDRSAIDKGLEYVSSAFEFELWCLELLRHLGFASFEVEGRGVRDRGVDIVASDKNNTFAVVECKWFRGDGRRLHSPVVYALRGAMDLLRADRGILMTNGLLSAAASLAAQKVDIEVWDRDWLLRAASQQL